MFFLSNPVPFNGQSYKKQNELGTNDQSLFRLWNKFTKISLLVIYYLTKFDMVYYKGVFELFQNCTLKFIQANWWHHKLFHFQLSFWIWEAWKGRGKIAKIWISREQKKLFRWSKKHFSLFLKGYHLGKNKNLTKNSRQKLYIYFNCTSEVYLKYTSFQKKLKSINKVLLKYRQSTFLFFLFLYFIYNSF